MNDMLKLQCTNCGAPMGYDIEKQTYRCPNCGQLTGVREAARGSASWRRMDAKDRRRIETDQKVYSCPSCGASVVFAPGEESETCDFCGSRLVAGEFEESADFPQFVLPFVLTRDEAEKRLLAWADEPQNKNTPEAEQIRRESSRLVGYYLPYKLVRGPVNGRITRQQAWREYHCRGFLEGALVSTSRQMDNAVLDAAEPFDLSGLQPFEHGFIAGHRVRLSDLPPAKTVRRTEKEAAEAFRPDAERTLHTEGIRVHIKAEDLLEVPLLLPMYILKSRGLLAVVNGQTGRVAATAEEEEEHKSGLWRLEPALLTLLLTLLFGAYIHFYIPGMLLFAAMTALIVFTGYGNGRYTIAKRIIRHGRGSAAERKGGILRIEEGENVLKNPLSNTPVFTENVNGTDVPVRIRFYTPGRILGIVARVAVMILLPWLLALLLSDSASELNPAYGSAWYVLTGMVALLYWIVGVRQDVYNHPLIYEKEKGGKKLGRRKDRKLSILASLGVAGSRRVRWSDLEKDEKKPVIGIAFVICVLLIGSVGAIMSFGGV